MSSPDSENFSIIQTKLNRPLVPVDLVSRPQLTNWLDERRFSPLTLVSAPAGYGKSTLISSWLDENKYPHAWVTLDEQDNDLVVFLSYLLAAISTIFPEALEQTHNLLGPHYQPPVRELVVSLTNEINQIEDFFVLVLDDYEAIQNLAVHDFINDLTNHPPQNMNLVLGTRVDPMISMVNLRAQSKLTEIRAQDLCFSEAEANVLLQNMLDKTVHADTAHFLKEQTEGWVTGLRLAALALRHRVGIQQIEEKPTANNRYVSDYLMSEILDNQMSTFSEWLLKTSILARFTADLCEEVCNGKSELDGDVFLEWLIGSNLFVIHLDNQGRWVRYHHLFRNFLQEELARRFSTDEIAALHRRASSWYADNSLIDEALHHALVAGDVVGAAQIVEQNRYKILRTGHWPILGKWLEKLPDEIIQQRPVLLLAKAWVANFQGLFGIIPPILQTIDRLSKTQTLERNLAGELDFFKGVLLFWEWQIDPSLELFHRAVARIHSENLGGRNEAEIYFAAASQMAGQGEMVIRKYRRILHNEAIDDPRKGYLLASIAFIHLLSGRLAMVYERAQQMVAMAARKKYDIVEGWGSYLMGYIQYEWNNFEAAADHFSQAVNKRYFLDINTPIDSYAGLVFSYQLMGQSAKASETVNLMLEFARHSNNPSLVTLARSVQARLALLQGDLLSAVRWLETADLPSDEGTMFFWIDLPRITRCRVLIAQGSETSLREATQKLQKYWQLCQATHNTPRMIEILLLQVLVLLKQELIDGALAALEKAVILARPGGYIRPFVALGPELTNLLDRLHSKGVAPDFIGQILKAVPDFGSETELTELGTQYQLVEPLTNREFEILSLLRKRLTNKEIAAELYISVGTVQQHLNHIYSKLDVKGRRQAIAKAAELELLSSAK